MNWPQKTPAWITAAFMICHCLYAQSGIWPAQGLRQNTPSTVTVRELRHVVPREAHAEMEKADRAILRHQSEEAIDHLKKAVLIDPEYVAARNNLGVYLLPVEPIAAIAQWEEAIKVNPRKGVLFSNLAIGYAVIHNLEAAERAARTSMELDRTSEQARAVLGVVLYQEHKYTVETFALLERASSEYPMMFMFAAKLLVERGDFRKARAHVQAYLSSRHDEYREDASQLLDLIDRTGVLDSPAARATQVRRAEDGGE